MDTKEKPRPCSWNRIEKALIKYVIWQLESIDMAQ